MKTRPQLAQDFRGHGNVHGHTKACPLAVISASLGGYSETFIHRHMTELLPGDTAVAVRQVAKQANGSDWPFPYCVFGKPSLNWRWVSHGARYLVGLSEWDPAQLTVERFLSEQGVEVVLSEYLDRSLRWLQVAKAMNIRFFAHAHGYDISSRLRSARMRRAYLALAEADGVITMSEHSRNRLIEIGLPPDRIHVVPYGVDVAPSWAARQPTDTVRCVAVGRMVEKKAPIMTLQAFAQAHRQSPRLRLDFVGTGVLLDSARRFIERNGLAGAVTLHGAQPNSFVQRLLGQGEIFIQHSRVDPKTGDEEGLPVAILEAMAAGLPVISTRHAGIPESVIEGETGLLVDEGDVDGMAAGLVQLAENHELRSRMGHASWVRARDRFSWQRERRELLTIMGFAGVE